MNFGRTPAAILGSKLVADLDSALGISLSIGKVSGWTDQGPLGNSLGQATAARRPVPGGSLNGLTGITFAAASTQYLLTTALTGIAAGDKPLIYAVADLTLPMNGGGGGGGVIELSDSAAANRVMNFVASGSNISTTALLGATPTSRTATTTSTTGAKRYDSLVNASNQAEIRVTDAAAVSAATTGGLGRAPTRMTVGVLADNTTWPMQGTIYKIVIVNPLPTVVQHADLVAYLKNRYAIA